MNEPITGYRDLTAEEIETINKLKAMEIEILKFIEGTLEWSASDLRWTHIGKTHIQQGFMALVRAVARPAA